jgi:hypothetical protein
MSEHMTDERHDPAQDDYGDERHPRSRFGTDELLEAAPRLARVVITSWLHTAEWALAAYTRAGSRALRMAGIATDEDDRDDRGDGDREAASVEALRRRGAELLRQSADVDFHEDTHPGYARILADLAPDEGRILRLLASEGPQPAVDVRSGWMPLNIGSELVAPGLTMIGAEAGCRNPDRVPAYLNNLERLGLAWFSREPVSDSLRYPVLEAQPDVTEAMREGHTRTVRRSIHLTPFGEDFCEQVLPPTGGLSGSRARRAGSDAG